MYIGRSVCREKQYPIYRIIFVLGAIAIVVTGYIVYENLLAWKYVFFLYGIMCVPAILFLSLIINYNRQIKLLLSFVGKYTLEVYLLHETICIPLSTSLIGDNYLSLFVSMFLAFLMAVIFSKLVTLFKNICNNVIIQ